MLIGLESMRRRVYIILVVLIFCFQNKSFALENIEKKHSGYNIILIIVDALRADHLSCYGYGKITSHNIDSFSKNSIRFTQAITQAPNTLLSFCSIFTSQYVATHGVDRIDKCLSDSALTLAEILKIFNYQTAAFVGGRLLHQDFKLNQGFDKYINIMKLKASFSDTLPLALDWLKEENTKNGNFFLLIHGNDLHPPYHTRIFDNIIYGTGNNKENRAIRNSKGYDYFSIYKRKVYSSGKVVKYLEEQDVLDIIEQYDKELKYADNLIGGFLNEVNKMGLSDNTCIILTADHGEGLFDHDFFFHDFNLFETTLHVPLIISVPGCKPAEVSFPVQLIDLMPTILDILNIPANKSAEGKSLMPLLNGEDIPEFHKFIFSQTPHGEMDIRTDTWKLICNANKKELYNLKADPREKNNLINTNKDAAEYLARELNNWLAGKKQNLHIGSVLNSNKIIMRMTKKREEERKELLRLQNANPGLK